MEVFPRVPWRWVIRISEVIISVVDMVKIPLILFQSFAISYVGFSKR